MRSAIRQSRSAISIFLAQAVFSFCTVGRPDWVNGVLSVENRKYAVLCSFHLGTSRYSLADGCRETTRSVTVADQ